MTKWPRCGIPQSVRTEVRLLLRFLCIDMQDKQQVPKFVFDFHSPFPVWVELAVNPLQNLASRDGCLPPRSMLVRQFLAFGVALGAVVIHMEKIAGHAKPLLPVTDFSVALRLRALLNHVFIGFG